MISLKSHCPIRLYRLRMQEFERGFEVECQGDPLAEASVRIDKMLRDASPEGVTVEWLLAHLFIRSPEFLFLTFAPVAIIPATSPIAGALLLIVAVPLVFHRRNIFVPRFLAMRIIRPAQLARAFTLAKGALKRYEVYALAHPHPPTSRHTWLAGALVTVLSATLLVPLPFSNVIPGFAIGTLAIASLEQDGRLFILGALLTATSLLFILLELISAYHLTTALL